MIHFSGTFPCTPSSYGGTPMAMETSISTLWAWSCDKVADCDCFITQVIIFSTRVRRVDGKRPFFGGQIDGWDGCFTQPVQPSTPAIAHQATVWQVHAIALGQSTFSLPAQCWENWSLIIQDLANRSNNRMQLKMCKWTCIIMYIYTYIMTYYTCIYI